MAFALGRTPWELARSLDNAAQFTWLAAYARIEPFGFEMENWRTAQIANTIARVNGGKTKLADFLPTIGKSVATEQTKEEQIAILNAIGEGARRRAG